MNKKSRIMRYAPYFSISEYMVEDTSVGCGIEPKRIIIVRYHVQINKNNVAVEKKANDFAFIFMPIHP